MSRACCVLGCPSRKGVPSHQFRSNPIYFNTWKNILYSPKIEHLTDKKLSKCVVCYRHFTDDDYLSHHSQRKLKQDAVPSKNLPQKDMIDMIENEIQLYKAKTSSNIAHNDVSCSVNRCSTVDNSSDTTNSMPVEVTPQNIYVNVEDTILHNTNISSNAKSVLPSTPKDVNVKVTLTKERSRVCLLPEDVQEADLTPKKRKLDNTAKHLQTEYSYTPKKLHSSQERFPQAKKCSKLKSIRQLFSKLSPSQRKFINIQIKNGECEPGVWIKLYHDLIKKKRS